MLIETVQVMMTKYRAVNLKNQFLQKNYYFFTYKYKYSY